MGREVSTLVRLPPPLRGRVGERGKPRARKEKSERISIFQNRRLTIPKTGTILIHVPGPLEDAARSSRSVGRGMRWTLRRQASFTLAGRKRRSVRRNRVVLAPR